MKTPKKYRNPPLVAVKTQVAAPASTNSQGLRAKPVREELSVICACRGPVGTGLGAVYVDRGGQTWPKNMFTHTNKHTSTYKQRKAFKAPYLRMRSDMKSFFFPRKAKKK